MARNLAGPAARADQAHPTATNATPWSGCSHRNGSMPESSAAANTLIGSISEDGSTSSVALTSVPRLSVGLDLGKLDASSLSVAAIGRGAGSATGTCLGSAVAAPVVRLTTVTGLGPLCHPRLEAGCCCHAT